MEGTVKKWFDAKGFGFIRPDGGGNDIFVHYSEIIDSSGWRALVPRQRVQFDVEHTDRGRQAVDVEVLGMER